MPLSYLEMVRELNRAKHDRASMMYTAKLNRDIRLLQQIINDRTVADKTLALALTYNLDPHMFGYKNTGDYATVIMSLAYRRNA